LRDYREREVRMAKVIAGMVMSLDGFVSDRNGDLSRLYPDFAAMQASAAVQEAIASTGAVVMGRRSYEMGDDYSDYEFQAPIFVLTHEPPDEPAKGHNDNLSFTFVTDGIDRAIALAKSAACEKDVTMIGGPNTICQALAAGLIDELHLEVRGVLLGDGLALFGRSDRPPTELDLIDISQSPGIIHLRYRVLPS
jgi:dihydrofolate reductase